MKNLFCILLALLSFQTNASPCEATSQTLDLTTEEAKIIQPLGQGAFGAVYKMQARNGFLFAEKHSDTCHLNEGDRRASLDEGDQRTCEKAFQREIDICQSLIDHPQSRLISILRVKIEEKIYIIAMELMEDDLYNALLSGEHAFETKDLRDICRQLVDGMQQLVSMNVTHRDLKPQNILLNLSKKLEVKITDFGLATQKTCDLRTIVGTPLFAAPEITFRNKNHSVYDHRCDIWGLGCLLYFITHRGAFLFMGAKTLQDVLRKQKRLIPQQIAPHEFKDDPCLLEIMRGCLEYKPEHRITVDEMCTKIEAAYPVYFSKCQDGLDASVNSEEARRIASLLDSQPLLSSLESTDSTYEPTNDPYEQPADLDQPPSLRASCLGEFGWQNIILSKIYEFAEGESPSFLCVSNPEIDDDWDDIPEYPK